MQSKHSLSILSSAVLSALLIPAYGQNTSQQEIEKIEVQGHKISLVNQDIAASVSVLNSKQIERNQESELTNLLKELPGVEINGSVTPSLDNRQLGASTGNEFMYLLTM